MPAGLRRTDSRARLVQAYRRSGIGLEALCASTLTLPRRFCYRIALMFRHDIDVIVTQELKIRVIVP